MKIMICLISIIFCLTSHLWADLQADQSQINRFRERIEVEINEAIDVTKLLSRGIQLDCCSRITNNKVQVYATPYEQELIKNMGLKVSVNPVRIGKNSRDASYHTYNTLTQELQRLANKYPSIAHLSSLGKTVEGREMWCMKISDNANEDEAEPKFKYISSMHGDEVVGKELMVYLIRSLLDDYGQDDRITKLVNRTQIFIVPSMNPDGTERHSRYNANWIDLNRNFPDVENDKNSDPKGRAIETQNVMKFIAKHNFALSINFHGGAVVVNYPWDTKSGNPPYVQLVKHLSLGYSKRNVPMFNSTSFPQGIINGYDWYEVDGGMQDWNYHWRQTLELTVELSNQKWPDASDLGKLWKDNEESLLWYMSQTHQGIHGTILDSETNAPIKATVKVQGVEKQCSSTETHGDFYRVLLPGRYNLTFSAPGYASKTITEVEVQDTSFSPTVLNVKLSAN